MFGIGIIGCGRIAQWRHIPEYAANPQAKLRGYYAVNQTRAKEMAEMYGGKAYETVEEMLSDPEIHAVSICTANHTHAQLTIQALEAGKHVLCEKPMAMTLAECEAMVAAARRCGKFLMIGQNQRLEYAHIQAKQLLDAGTIGKVISFRTTFGHGGPETWTIQPGLDTWFFSKEKAVMGAMADLGIHKTDLIQYLTGQRVVRTTARLATLDKHYADGQSIGVDDNAFCIYELSGGIMGMMSASWTCYGGQDSSTVLYGTEGVMRIYDDPAMPLKVIGKDGQVQEYPVEMNQRNSGVIDMWLDALTRNVEPEISGESALTAMRAVLASLESSETGKLVEIPANRE